MKERERKRKGLCCNISCPFIMTKKSERRRTDEERFSPQVSEKKERKRREKKEERKRREKKEERKRREKKEREFEEGRIEEPLPVVNGIKRFLFSHFSLSLSLAFSTFGRRGREKKVATE